MNDPPSEERERERQRKRDREREGVPFNAEDCKGTVTTDAVGEEKGFCEKLERQNANRRRNAIPVDMS